MERNTILAIVLSSIVLIVSFVIQGVLYAPKPQSASEPVSPVTAIDTMDDRLSGQQLADAFPPAQGTAPSYAETTMTAVQGGILTAGSSADTQEAFVSLRHVTIDTDILTVVLTNAGGDVVSWKLKDHKDKDSSVDMIFAGNSEARAFSIAFGDLDAAPVSELLHVNQITPLIVEFYRDFTILSGAGTEERFRLIKRYEFKPNDYMFELTVTLDGGFSKHSFNFFGNAYTLSFGPQIGPRFAKLDSHYEYRQYFTFTNGRRRNAKVNEIIDNRPSWAAITGKYFTFVAIPYLAQFSMNFSDRAEPGLPSASRFYLQRPAANISKIEDTYRFYLGPRSPNILANYNTGNNGFNIRDTRLDEVANTRGILAPLEVVLKWLLIRFYSIVKNYGVAIILLTMLIKILFFPLTKKGSEATMRMQALAPKIKELQDKYKSDPKKLQLEMGKFYQQEGYNPISGCLPMLLQLPIFIAMYGLFNNHFDLRGAVFIPGWIPDLSVPEAIWLFPNDFRMPLLGWNALRALPFIYVGSQLLYGKVTQMPGQQSNQQMKMMLYVMPIVFFFVLYDVPSGLLIYWIFSNLLTLVQQLIINRYVLAKRAAQAAAQPEPVIAPKKKKK